MVSLMTSFKKHLAETRDREALNAVSLYTDIEAYCNVSGKGQQTQKKKDDMAAVIYRSVESHYLKRFFLSISERDAANCTTGKNIRQVNTLMLYSY